MRRVPEHAAPRALALVASALAGVLATPAVTAFTEDQWSCRPGADGEWACEEAEIDAGPFEPVDTAPVYSTREARQRARDSGTVAGQTTEQARLTWVPRQALPPAERAEVPEWCGGAYQEHAWSEEDLLADPATALIGLSADRGEYRIDESARLDGGVRITQGARRIGAERADYDATTRELVLAGDVRLQEPGLLLRSDAARVDLLEGDARLEDAEFVLYEGGFRGRADALVRENEVLSIEGGEFTRCAPGDRSWVLAAGRIELPEDSPVGVARNAQVKVKDIPVFWTPYLAFPTSDARKSGWLFPSLSFSDEDGVDLSAPYYLNLAPNADATITPRVMSERGVLLEGEVRQLTGNMRNTLGGAYMPEDDNYDGELTFDEFEALIRRGLRQPAEFEAEDRWLARFEHEGRWFEGVTTSVDYAGVSDDDYLRDLGTDLSLSSRPQLERTARVRLRRGGLEAQAWAEDIQILERGVPETYRRLPQFDLSWHERFGDVPMVFGVDAQYAEFERDDAALTAARDRIEGSRVHLVPRFRLPLENAWGFLDAEVAWQYTRWNLDLPAGLRQVPTNDPAFPNTAALDDNPKRVLPTGVVDARLRFERDFSIAGTPILHTLEPRLHYLYIEDEDQDDLPLFDTTEYTFGTEQLFRQNRFSGIDRIGDANQLTLALGSRVISRSDGTELLEATVGRILYFDDRDVTLDGNPADRGTHDTSGWVTDLVVRLGAGLDARALWVWDEQAGERDQTRLALRYRPDGRRIFNVGYRTRGEDIEQFDLAFTWPVTPQTALIGRWFYDLEQEEVVEAFGGVQYDDCCWRVRLVGRQFLRNSNGLDPTDTETGVFVEVVMKGLAGFDGGLGSVLEDGIHGYREDANDAYSL
jgi:LPS-assembly protein